MNVTGGNFEVAVGNIAMLTPFQRVAYFTGAFLVFCFVARLTRAPARRIFGALCAVVVYTALSAPIDEFAARHDFWTYPSCHDPAHPTLDVYLAQALEFVGTIALFLWRAARAFGVRGVAVLFVLVLVLGPARDFTVAAVFPWMIHFGPFPTSLMWDIGAWAIVFDVAIVVSRLVAGRWK